MIHTEKVVSSLVHRLHLHLVLLRLLLDLLLLQELLVDLLDLVSRLIPLCRIQLSSSIISFLRQNFVMLQIICNFLQLVSAVQRGSHLVEDLPDMTLLERRTRIAS